METFSLFLFTYFFYKPRSNATKDNKNSIFSYYRSSRRCVFCIKGVLRNFTKFTGKHLCQSLYFNKVAGLRLWHRCFLVNFARFLRTPFLTQHLGWLLLILNWWKEMIFVLNVNKITTECSLFQKFSFFSSISVHREQKYISYLRHLLRLSTDLKRKYEKFIKSTIQYFVKRPQE